MAKKVPAISANVSVSAIGLNIRPSTRCIVYSGMNAVSKITLENSIGRPISVVASRIADKTDRVLPLRSCRMRNKFSITTTAESTMMPKSMAPMEMRLAGIPRKSSMRNAPSSANGTASATTTADRQLPSPRNKISTISTRAMPSIMLWPTVCSVRSVSPVRS